MFTRHPRDVNAPPTRLRCQLARAIHVNELISDEMNMKTVLLVQLEDPQPL